jgi:hypothetical protein
VDDRTSLIHYTFLAASTECSVGSNDHFVVGVGGAGGPGGGGVHLSPVR